METTSYDLIGEYHSEDIMSINHSRTIQRVSAHLEEFDNEYDTFPELELKRNGKPAKPDIPVFPNLPEDWNSDIIFF